MLYLLLRTANGDAVKRGERTWGVQWGTYIWRYLFLSRFSVATRRNCLNHICPMFPFEIGCRYCPFSQPFPSSHAQSGGAAVRYSRCSLANYNFGAKALPARAIVYFAEVEI